MAFLKGIRNRIKSLGKRIGKAVRGKAVRGKGGSNG